MVVIQTTANNIIWHMHFACGITNATGTHPEYVIDLVFHYLGFTTDPFMTSQRNQPFSRNWVSHVVKLNPPTVLRLCAIKHRRIKLLTSLVFEVLFGSRIALADVKNNVLKPSFQHRC
jgi:hypothetical protein